MLLRKSRKHLHGASNKSLLSHSATASFSKTLTHLRKDPLEKYHPATFTSHLKKRKHPHSPPHSLCADHPQDGEVVPCQMEVKLRKIYQGRKNIMRALDNWGFDSKGYITKEDFTQKIADKIGYAPSEAEVADVFQKYSEKEGVLNVEEFIRLIHRETQGSMFNQRLFPCHRPSLERNLKIDNLKQNLKSLGSSEKEEVDFSTIDKFLFKINSSISKMKDVTDGKLVENKQAFFQRLTHLSNYGEFERKALKTVERTIDFDELKYFIQTHKTVDHLFLDPLLRKTHIAKKRAFAHPENELFIDKMINTSMTPHRLLTSSEKRFDFNPTNLLGINQQKTRFFQPFNQNYLEPHPQPHQGVSSNQKDLILQSIRCQSELHRQRYENKLQKLRFWKQAQQEKIARKDDEVAARDERKLDRIRHEQQAYNYVNFIKKKWE